MDALHFLTNPVGAAVAGLTITLIGELFGRWLSSRSTDKTPTPSINVQGHAQVRDINVGDRWQTVHHHHHCERRDGSHAAGPASTGGDSDGSIFVGLAILFMAVGSVACLIMSRYWPIFELTVQVVVALGIFLSAALWRRWPQGLPAQFGLRLLIVVLGASMLWAVSVIPYGIASVPDLAYLDRHTRRLDFGDALRQVLSILGLAGMTAYVYRLVGLLVLTILLLMLCAKAWGVALISQDDAVDARSWRTALGARLTGSRSFGWPQVAAMLIPSALAIALIHPATLEWLLTRQFTVGA